MSNATTTKPITIHPLIVDSHDHPRVLCFGEALMHRINRPEADTENKANTPDHPGGAPASVACGVTRLGTPASVLGRIGDDPLGRQLLKLFERRQVSTPALQTDPKRPTRVALLKRKPGGDLCLDDFLGDLGQGFADSAVVPATLAESVKPLLGEARWLLVSTNALVSGPSAMALDLLLKRATAQGLGIALEIDWCPGFWGLAPDAGPSAEVLRRFRPLAEKATLILASAEEAEGFFGSTDPTTIHGALAKRPAVLVTGREGTVRWCLGGRQGTLSPVEESAPSHPLGVREAFTAALLDGLCRRPELLEAPAPGGDGVTGPGPIEDLLRFASACGALVGRTEGAIEPQPGREAVKAFLNA
ncbi:PfkB family carbohydrate kinase [Cyanobium gracile]|uniref:PfkB family carbohydrate kinase n=1 Tax=Cyanobium gracile UHCC 0281 TaxID=3110309 RepID=A0ABU5SSV5_9CYAN|nr:PfkB family carbohydrate kinase [Cyanobium gracile]MEA5441586.1 PfkB family carbohydrate kinase [Cyanobium gracile UHCC 0281]